MKRILLALLTVMLMLSAEAQIPQQLNYQGIARNASGAPIAHQDIAVRISIIDSAAGGQSSYQETRKIRTNYVGLFNIIIGSAGATNVSGSMQNVNWSTGRKHIKLEIDPNGANNFALAGITQLQSVPYALSATAAGTAGGDLTGSYPSPSIANNAVTVNKIADGSITASKLDPSLTASLSAKLDASDTASMLSPYASKASLLDIGEDKLNISDTSEMLSPYYRSATANIDFAAANDKIDDEITRAVNAENTLNTAKENVSNKSTDGTFASNSDTKYPSEKATKTYVDTQIASVASGNITGNAANVTGIVAIANGGTGSATKNFVDLTSAQTIAGAKSFSNALSVTGSITGSSFVKSGGTSSQYLMADGSVSTLSTFSGTGTANYLPKFATATSFGNSLIYDNGSRIGIATSNPSSLFQIGAEGSTDLNLKFDFVSNTSLALKLGYRSYQWRIKANTNSGTLDPLVFSYYNGSTDIDRLVITNYGVNIPDNLTVTGNVSGANATFSSNVSVNNGQFTVNKTNNRIGFFTANPSSLFQIAGESNTDLNLKYDFDPNNSSALKFGYRGYQWRLKTSTESGVLRDMVFSYYNGSTDVEMFKIAHTGGITASSIAKTGGTSSQFLKADGSVDNNTYLTASSTLIRDVADEVTASNGQTGFTLTQVPSVNSKVKMYINGMRISKTAYSVSGSTLTYIPGNNGGYVLSTSDLVQFDYFY